jgi:glycolate oxidase FAD binding subunit
VSGRGEAFKSGGRVVKNVTGYDLCKLLAGSFGTLAVMTEVTIKTLPRPETEATVIVLGLDDATANRALAAALASTCDVSAAAHLPSALVMYFDGLHVMQAATACRVEGFAPSVRHRREQLAVLLRPFGPVEQIDEAHSRALWRSVRDARPFSASALSADRPLWRISTAPARGFDLAARMTPGSLWFYDWGGGLIWVAPPPSDDGGAAVLRRAMREIGGHATLIRAPASLRAAVDVFEPQPAALAALTRRVKSSFDPKGVLNPGRMWAGV